MENTWLWAGVTEMSNYRILLPSGKDVSSSIHKGFGDSLTVSGPSLEGDSKGKGLLHYFHSIQWWNAWECASYREAILSMYRKLILPAVTSSAGSVTENLIIWEYKKKSQIAQCYLLLLLLYTTWRHFMILLNRYKPWKMAKQQKCLCRKRANRIAKRRQGVLILRECEPDLLATHLGSHHSSKSGFWSTRNQWVKCLYNYIIQAGYPGLCK